MQSFSAKGCPFDNAVVIEAEVGDFKRFSSPDKIFTIRRIIAFDESVLVVVEILMNSDGGRDDGLVAIFFYCQNDIALL